MEIRGKFSLVLRSIIIILIALAATLALTESKTPQASSTTQASACSGCPNRSGCGLPQNKTYTTPTDDCSGKTKHYE